MACTEGCAERALQGGFEGYLVRYAGLSARDVRLVGPLVVSEWVRGERGADRLLCTLRML